MAFETARVALIRYKAPDGASYVGSGLIINENAVLTADHVADGTEHCVEWAGGSRDVSEILRSGTPDVDLAILTLSVPAKGVERIGYARVGRDRVGRIEDCVAVGFPLWKNDGNNRRSAQIDGVVPTAEGLEETADAGLREGFLTLVGTRAPGNLGMPAIPTGFLTDASELWGGMSGAVVIAGGLVIGVVRSINIAAGGQSLTITPLTAIDGLPDEKRQQFWQALGIIEPRAMPVIPTQRQLELAQTNDYVHDVFVSYPTGGDVEPWVRNRFIHKFKKVLQEELGHQRVFIAGHNGAPSINWHIALAHELKRSRILLAILSKQYFRKASRLSELASMIQRQADVGYGTIDNPMRLVHAISASDCQSEESLPEEYRGKFEVVDFTSWAYDIQLPDFPQNKEYTDALRNLAETVGEMVNSAPPWRQDFPVLTPVVSPVPPQGKPRF